MSQTDSANKGAPEALREFAQWVATNRAHNGSEYPRGQSLYNECLNAVLWVWVEDFIRSIASAEGHE